MSLEGWNDFQNLPRLTILASCLTPRVFDLGDHVGAEVGQLRAFPCAFPAPNLFFPKCGRISVNKLSLKERATFKAAALITPAACQRTLH